MLTVALPDLAVPLAPLTTLRLGGPARRLVDAETADEVVEALREPALVIGGGSNLVIADEGWPGTVVRISTRGRRVERRPDGSVLLTVEAGEEWDDVVARTVADGLGGLECLSGIPGSHGATPVQNVGAYGVEIADAAASTSTSSTGAPGWCAGSRPPTSASATARACSRAAPTRSCCGCGSRCPATAPANRSATRAGQGPRRRRRGRGCPPRRVREAVLGLRRGKGMVLDPADHDTWSAGSFFTNPVLHRPSATAPPDGAPRWPVGRSGQAVCRPG